MEFIEPNTTNNVPFKPDYLFNDIWNFWYVPVVNKEIIVVKDKDNKNVFKIL